MCGWGLGGQSRRGLGSDFEPALVAAAVVLAVGVVFSFAAAAVAVAVIVLLGFVVGSGYFRRRGKFAWTKMRLGVVAAVVEDLGVVRHLGGAFFFSSCSYWSLPLHLAPIPSVLWASGRERFHLDLQKAGPVEYPRLALQCLFVPCTSFAHYKYPL